MGDDFKHLKVIYQLDIFLCSQVEMNCKKFSTMPLSLITVPPYRISTVAAF